MEEEILNNIEESGIIAEFIIKISEEITNSIQYLSDNYGWVMALIGILIIPLTIKCILHHGKTKP